jgi:hypothetical protein
MLGFMLLSNWSFLIWVIFCCLPLNVYLIIYHIKKNNKKYVQKKPKNEHIQKKSLDRNTRHALQFPFWLISAFALGAVAFTIAGWLIVKRGIEKIWKR